MGPILVVFLAGLGMLVVGVAVAVGGVLYLFGRAVRAMEHNE